MRFLENILAFFYPERCILCGRAGSVDENGLCADCAKRQPDVLVRFFALHAGRRDYTLECRAPQRYKEPFRTTLQRFKFGGETKLSTPLAGLMLPALDRNRTWDCIVPVPISRARLRQRGYNQSELLAKELAKKTGIPCRTDILEKIKNNRTQHSLSAKERVENVRGVYRVKGAERLRILLLDDIVTTGATAVECSKVLYRGGADYVSCISCTLAD